MDTKDNNPVGKRKRAYSKPRIEAEEELERVSLASCSKNAPSTPGCGAFNPGGLNT